ncbi:MAG TPA: SWIM zinc finger family protein [Methylomirabilota bacterium]
MAWYGGGGWDYFPPYVSVAEKRARGAMALAKLLKKSKRPAEPVVLSHRKRQLATTFWGQAWADNLERYADLANRLPRGRAYLRNGSVLDLTIARGRVEAYVAGTELYRVTIGLAPLAPARWKRIVARCTGRIGSLVGLLRGELSADVLAVLTDPREGLFPEPRELALDCSCPDAAELCKHVAAVLYGVALRLDARPELFFDLRQVDQAELIGSATGTVVGRPRPAAGKRIAADRLSAVFGIQLEPTGPADAGLRTFRTAATRRSPPASSARRGQRAGRASRGR